MTLTLREAMIKALQDAGHRGCTKRELMAAGGCNWRKHLRRIEEDYLVNRVPSKFPSRDPFRWVLLYERDEPHGETCEIPPQVHLFEPERFARRDAEPHWSTSVAA